MRLHLLDDCVTARVEGRCSPDLTEALDQALSAYRPGYFHSRLYKLRRWDGKDHLLDRAALTFPAGVVHRALGAVHGLLGPDYRVEVVDDRPEAPWGSTTPPLPELQGVTLRPDQRDAVLAALGGKRGTLCLPTGFGKTEVASAVIKAAAPARCLFLVNKKTLLAQAADRLEARLGGRVGRLGGGYRETGRRVTVATVQTAYQRLGALAGFLAAQRVVIYDEAHTVAPGMSFPVLRAVPAPVRLGLSATIREAGRRLCVEAYLGPILVERTVREMVDAGHAADAHVYMVRAGGLVSEAGTFDQVYDAGVVRNRQRNELVVEVVREQLARGLKVLVLVVRIDHGRLLQRELDERACIRAPFLHGESPTDELEAELRRFGERANGVLIMSTIGDQGLDVPSLDVLVLAGGGVSPLRTIQRLGRALRVTAHKTEATIVDFWDLSSGLLRRHSEARRRTFEKKGFPVRVVDAAAEVE